MDVTKFFIHYRKPSQYIYGGENYLEIYRYERRRHTRVALFEKMSIFDLTGSEAAEVKKSLLPVDTGLVLNSNPFIFNIFEFEKLPFREKVRKELVEWRLQKVFPEAIDQYEHHYFKLNPRRILSVLFKKSLKEKTEETFLANGIRLVFLGNSTIEAMNNVRKHKPAADFFLEIDRNFCLLVFSSQSAPFYIRKFRIDRNADMAGEVVKTVNFVKNSYAVVPRTFSLILDAGNSGAEKIRTELSGAGFKEIPFSSHKKMFLPG